MFAVSNNDVIVVSSIHYWRMLMRLSIIAAVVVVASESAPVLADCNSPLVADAASALQNNTVCATLGRERWQEFHAPGGNLIDYKKGPSDRVDPSKSVGSWSASADTVTYDYGRGGTFRYQLHNNGGGSYTFCGTRNIDAVLRPGQVAC
jgi:hypothetical protein